MGESLLVFMIRATFVLLYGLVFVTGMVGNLILIYIILSKRKMRTMVNLMILNLCFSDLLTLMIAAPMTPVVALWRNWIFGSIMCKLYPLCTALSVYVSSLTCTAIAVQRHYIITRLKRTGISTKAITVTIVGIWLLALFLSSPLLPVAKLVTQTGTYRNFTVTVTKCREMWNPPELARAYTVITVGCQFIVPECMITYCCVRLVQRVQQQQAVRETLKSEKSNKAKTVLVSQAKPTESGGEPTCANSNHRRSAIVILLKNRTNKLLLSISVLYFAAWMPLSILLVTLEFSEQARRYMFTPVIYATAHWLAMLSTTFNVVLYGFCNNNFKQYVKALCRRPTRSTENHEPTNVNGSRLASSDFNLLNDQGASRKMRKVRHHLDKFRNESIDFLTTSACYVAQNHRTKDSLVENNSLKHSGDAEEQVHLLRIEAQVNGGNLENRSGKDTLAELNDQGNHVAEVERYNLRVAELSDEWNDLTRQCQQYPWHQMKSTEV